MKRSIEWLLVAGIVVTLLALLQQTCAASEYEGAATAWTIRAICQHVVFYPDTQHHRLTIKVIECDGATWRGDVPLLVRE